MDTSTHRYTCIHVPTLAHMSTVIYIYRYICTHTHTHTCDSILLCQGSLVLQPHFLSCSIELMLNEGSHVDTHEQGKKLPCPHTTYVKLL